MNEASPQLGFGASVIAFVAVVAYGVAQTIQVLNIVSYPLADILIYGTSLCISVPFLITILALHDAVDSRQRLWTCGALLLGVMYVTYVVLVYAVQLSVVIPKSMQSPSGTVLGVAPQTLFWDIDGLGYISMGVSTLFAAFSLPRKGPRIWARRLLLSNGPTLPFGQPGSFGAPGAGGSFAFADPQAGIGYAYVTNRMGTALTGIRATWY